MRAAFIVDAVRTPIGKLGGALSMIRADDLAAVVLKELLVRNPTVAPDAVDDVLLGCANQAGEDNRNVARMALLLAGYPHTVPGETINRLCASGLSAVVHACHAVALNEADVVVAGGVEHMTRAPYVMGKPEKPFERSPQIFDTSIGWRFVNPRLAEIWGVDSMGETAENLSELYAISRGDQDAFALRSQQRAAAAAKHGRLAREIVPVSIPQKRGEPLLVSRDEFPRPETTLDALASLRPAFRKEGGRVTAGNSSGINDGAGAVLVCSEDGLKRFGLKPKARFRAAAVAGVEPRIMGIGPVPATRKALLRANASLDAVSVIELNEAFAAQSLACLRDLGIPDDDPRVNPNGGAIALGHPLGMSGARLVQTAVLELEQQPQGALALCTMCVGVGQGMAALFERA